MDATGRFSDRVANYVRYRPSYPTEVVPWLASVGVVAPDSRVADLGSGTGILSKLFLDYGCRVWGVEPNAPMGEAGAELLKDEARFTPLVGSAEATTLPPHSVDLVVAGQAFHWFDVPRAAAEARRILAVGGAAALLWNQRQLDATPFLAAYEAFLRKWGTDYATVSEQYERVEDIRLFFGGDVASETFPNEQVFDYAGLEGRLLSSSYVPTPGSETYAPMLEALKALFTKYEDDGVVRFVYDTKVYAGVVV